MMKSGSVFVLAFAVIFINSVCANVKPEEFFLRYGYLGEKSGNNRAENPTPEEMEKAILQFQRFTGLPQTGRMDKRTKKKMIAPRCGVKDIGKNLAEYQTMSKWPTNVITWRLKKFSQTSRLSPGQQRRAISQSLNRWASVTPLVFRETRGKPTLDISFERRNHGDGHPFDGRGMVLAHAYFPQDGSTHFDDDEEWLNSKTKGADLETVAAHEFGHALGLAHSDEPKSLMAPYYQTFPDGFTLHRDDVAGIQRLYGRKQTRATPRPPRRTTRRPSRGSDRRGRTTQRPPRRPGFCNYSYKRIDAAMRISRHDFVFVNRGEVIDGRNGRKMAVQRLFPRGPKLVQAALYSDRTRQAFLFKDRKIFAYTLGSDGKFRLVKTYPKSNNNPYTYRPDSAIKYFDQNAERLLLLKNGRLFFFVPHLGNTIRNQGFNLFRNIPSKVDATIASGYELYFIAKKKAYKSNNKDRTVSSKGIPVTVVFNKCRR